MMLRIVGFVFVLLFFATPSHAADTVFRNFVWGVSPDEVRQYETAVFYRKEGESLFFLEKPDEFRRVIRYDFQEGQLVAGQYDYVELTRPNAQDILDFYTREKLNLEKLYGQGSEEFFWKNKTYANFPQYWARALLAGDLKIRTQWQMPDTLVTLETSFDGTFYKLYYRAEKTDVKKASVLNLTEPAPLTTP